MLNYFSVQLSEYVSETSLGSALALCILSLLLGAVIRVLTGKENLGYGVSLALMAGIVAVYYLDDSLFQGLLPQVMAGLSLFQRFSRFVNGVFDVTAIVYYLSVIIFFLFLTVQALEKRRYN